MEALINKLKKSPEVSLQVLRHIFASNSTQIHQAHEAWKIVKQKQKPNRNMYGWYLLFFARRGDLEAVEKGVRDAKADGIHARWNTIFAQLHAVRQEISQTLSLLWGNLDANPNSYKYDFAFCLKTVEKAKDMLEFEKIYEKMLERGLQQDLVIENTFVAVYAKLGEMEEAVRWVERLKKNGFADIKTYTTIIMGFSRLSKMEGVHKWVGEMQKQGFELDRLAFNTVLSLYTKTGETTKAAELYENNEKLGITPDSSTYTMFIDAAMKQNKFDEAQKWLKKMQANGVQLNPITINALIDGYVKQGDMKTAEQLFHAMNEHEETKPTSSTFASLINGSVELFDFEKAFYWFDEMKKAGIRPTVVSYSTLIKGFVRMKDMPSAVFWFDKMKSEGIAPDRIVISCLIKGFEAVNDIEEAGYYLKEIQKLELSIPQKSPPHFPTNPPSPLPVPLPPPKGPFIALNLKPY
eukprot:Phypoly_transcript_08850.p1 GENE.Phypoly_transcript_08850~~Phypoly_transcript_08850.p1  ORF type:complete len:489 (-),score=98.84 Phypoly_transcript_08850:3-1397(-)